MLFINRRSLRRPAPRNDVISDPRALLPRESQAGTYDADDEDLPSNAIRKCPSLPSKGHSFAAIMSPERIAAWKRQQLREQPQRELDEASIVVGPPTDVDELNDCWVPAAPTPALVPHRRYINQRNPAMKHVFDIENRLPVPFVLESDDAACIEYTDSARIRMRRV